MSLIIEQVTKQPLVVIIGQTTPFLGLLTQAMRQKSLDCKIFLPTDIKSLKNCLENEQESLYKIIFDITSTENGQNSLDEILNTITAYGHITTIIAKRQTTFHGSDDFYKENLSEQEHHLSQIHIVRQNLPNSQLFVGQDVVFSHSPISYPLKFFVLNLKNLILFNPDQEIYLQSDESFLRSFLPQITKPHKSQTIVFRGQKQESLKWLEIIQTSYEQYFHKKTQIINLVSNVIKPESSEYYSNDDVLNNQYLEQEIIVTTPDVNIEDVVDRWVRILPSHLGELTLKDRIVGAEKKTTEALIKPNSQLINSQQLFQNINEAKKTAQGLLNTAKTSVKTISDQLVTHSPTHHNLLLKKTPINQQKNDVNLLKRSFIDKRQNSHVNIDQQETFVENISQLETDKIKNQSEQENITIDNQLTQIFGKNRQCFAKKRLSFKTGVTKKIIAKSKKNRVLFYSGVVVISLGLLIMSLIGVYQTTLGQAVKNVSILIQSPNQTPTDGESRWLSLLERQIVFYENILEEDFFIDAKTLLKVSRSLKQSRQQLDQYLQKVGNVFQKIVLTGDNSEEDVKQLMAQAQTAYETLSYFQADLGEVNLQAFSAENQGVFQQQQDQIELQREKLSQYSQIQNILEGFLGFEQQKTYAVLIQNNLELRPTGGFIQSVLILTFDKGNLINSQTFSVYEIDNRLPSEIKPPDELERILGEKRWFLRDSNWDPDFPTTAKRVEWFINESLGIKLDGVIALNYDSIRQILSETGSLELAALQETITEKNFFERILFHSGSELSASQQPGSDYYSLLAKELVRRTTILEGDKAAQFLSVLHDSFNQKQSLIYLNDESLQQSVRTLGWDGGLVEPECPSRFASSDCYVDVIFQVEANVGLNKVNNSVYRDISHSINIQPNVVKHKRIVKYQNKSRSITWPEGNYRAYVKFYTNQDSKLISIEMNDKQLLPNEMSQETDKGRRVFGLLIDVPKGEELLLELNYQVPTNKTSAFSYVFFDQKQAGYLNNSLKTYLSYLPTMTPEIIAPKATVEGDLVMFEPDNKGHAFVGVSFE
ncbi:MAG: DUF4012 domain-containing protein [Patescibacteria group bacterium]